MGYQGSRWGRPGAFSFFYLSMSLHSRVLRSTFVFFSELTGPFLGWTGPYHTDPAGLAGRALARGSQNGGGVTSRRLAIWPAPRGATISLPIGQAAAAVLVTSVW